MINLFQNPLKLPYLQMIPYLAFNFGCPPAFLGEIISSILGPPIEVVLRLHELVSPLPMDPVVGVIKLLVVLDGLFKIQMLLWNVFFYNGSIISNSEILYSINTFQLL